MTEQVVKILEGKTERVLIVERADGAFTYRKSARADTAWAAAGPDCGIYESAETAEAEARSRVWWLAASR